MNKKEFLEELEERLIGISKEDKEDILQDYEEHFKIGKKKKRSEGEIAKSLGNPKEIAKEIRKELSKNDRNELKTEAIETLVSVKQFTKNLFNETKEKAEEIYENFDSRKLSHWFLLVFSIILFFIILRIIGNGFLVFLILALVAFLIIKIFEEKKFKFPKIESKKKTKRKEEKKREKSFVKLFLLIIVNILFIIWIWFAFLAIIFALIVTSIVMIISGILLIILSIFYLISYSNVLLTDIYLSVLFAGVGIGILGFLFVWLFENVMSWFFVGTRGYIKLNQKVIKK